MNIIEKKFNEANLACKISEKPVAPTNNKKVFQMTIRNSRNKDPKKEFFEIFCGDKQNQIEVISVNKSMRQILLSVKEPERTFVRKEWNYKTYKWTEKIEITPPGKRKFLLGHDERRLFISQLPNSINLCSIIDAHKKLKPKDFINKVYRQGEWFFEKIEDTSFLRSCQDLIERKKSINQMRGSKPHIADEIIRLKSENKEPETIYIRGKVRHSDHATLKFKDWVRVYRNTELIQKFGTWID